MKMEGIPSNYSNIVPISLFTRDFECSYSWAKSHLLLLLIVGVVDLTKQFWDRLQAPTHNHKSWGGPRSKHSEVAREYQLGLRDHRQTK